jgi:hypothetical protein
MKYLRLLFLLVLILFSARLLSDEVKLKKGETLRNVKVTPKGADITVLHCNKKVQSFSSGEVLGFTRTEVNCSEEEAKQKEKAAKKAQELKEKQEQERIAAEQKRLEEQRRASELAKQKQACESRGDTWTGSSCKEKAVVTTNNAKSGHWSAYQGKMNWHGAQAKCTNQGMRLPTSAEFEFAYKTGVTKSWEADWYWTSEENSDVYAQVLNTENGVSNKFGYKDFGASVRCIQLDNDKSESAKKVNGGKQKTKPAKIGSENWSDYQGEMNWNDAKAKCANLEMRLPTPVEFRTAFNMWVTKSWDQQGYYWTSEEQSILSAYAFDPEFGVPNLIIVKDTLNHVRCIR